MHSVATITLEASARSARVVREPGVVHPRDVDAQFENGKVRNWFSGSSIASTELPDAMHYRGLLRIARPLRDAAAAGRAGDRLGQFRA